MENKKKTYASDADYIKAHIEYFADENFMSGFFVCGDGFGYGCKVPKMGRGTKGVVRDELIARVLKQGTHPVRGYYEAATLQ